MKPLGRRPIRWPGKVDHHPGKGWINWWESEKHNPKENKALEKRQWKKEIEEEIND